ncbi:MAG: hypothetical protein EVB11_04150 [Winogradskyella sp.]|nr:MAG: hypothetical protein EVB11_04150 [Winogradskyella sp.]
MFDYFYISFLKLTKPKWGKKAMSMSLHYISLVEIAFYGLLASFFAAFASQLNIGKISASKAITLTVLCVLFIYMKNWMRYNGKRRNVLNAKSKKQKLQSWKLIVLPLACVLLALVFFQAI